MLYILWPTWVKYGTGGKMSKANEVKNVRDLIEPWEKNETLIVIFKHENNEKAKYGNFNKFWDFLKRVFNINGSKWHSCVNNEAMYRTVRGNRPLKKDEMIEALEKEYPEAKVKYEKSTSSYNVDLT